MHSTAAVQEKILTLNFAALFGAAFLTFFAVDFFIPVLPYYVLDQGGSGQAVGLLMGVFTFFSVILRPLQGRTADRKGRKKMLLTGIATYALAGLVLPALPSLAVLFLIRALQGIGWGAFLLAFNTMTIDLAPTLRRGEAVGLMGIAPPLSLATAPLLAEFLRMQNGGYPRLFIVSIAAALAALLLSAAIKEPPTEHDRGGGTSLLSGKVVLPSVMIFFFTVTFGGIITFLPLLGQERGFSSVGAFFTVFALTTMIVRPLTGRLSDRLDRHRVFLPGLGIIVVSLVTIALAGSISWLLLGGFLLGCGMGSAYPAILALAADRLAVGERGVGLATFTIAFDSGILVGSILFGLLLARLDFTALFLIGAAIAFLPVIIFIARPYRKNHRT